MFFQLGTTRGQPILSQARFRSHSAVDARQRSTQDHFNFGGKRKKRTIRGLAIKKLRKILGRAKLVLGQYKSLKHIEPQRIERMVFVCRGNVCRSPYAEAAAKVVGFSAISCGVDVRRSAPAESTGVHAAFLRGKDISKHMSRSIFDLEIISTDLLVAMDPSHLPVARRVAASFGSQVTLLGLWGTPPVPDIMDPYDQSLDTFAQCFDYIDDSLEGLTSCLTR